jgi:ribokinase
MVVRADGAPAVIPAPRVDAIDTVGAGDTFVGVLAADLAAGRSLDDAVHRAVVAAALSTTREGARGGMPTSDELDGALER